MNHTTTIRTQAAVLSALLDDGKLSRCPHAIRAQVRGVAMALEGVAAEQAARLLLREPMLTNGIPREIAPGVSAVYTAPGGGGGGAAGDSGGGSGGGPVSNTVSIPAPPPGTPVERYPAPARAPLPAWRRWLLRLLRRPIA